ncbi:alpha/beta fold hydrolase [Vibrio cincinnatiensis]|uniref:alpha/beta fold hydrolase n=1 Tax=Vibrio cincinnatiensis TaxID=675 RepID=UPI001EDF658A|nr:alpha/beta fold hydrolase [Vibrio cincinnatiensis]MCG3736867.1 alpha/beta fold hydrolase [Vibrio cincinnatiensis]MCG3748001.1 alpha/beta fold hydrolase [Vibrio cincinnatiensis]
MNEWVTVNEPPNVGESASTPTWIFAHGAGADKDHEFMSRVATGLAERGIRVVRFNFPYMIKRSQDGKRRPPDKAATLLASYTQIIEQWADKPVVIGGKSMGGRIASLLAEHPNVRAIACLGFPFHPPGKPDKNKGAHLASITKPCLILQGERDRFGSEDECQNFALSEAIQLHFIPDGDHSFVPRKRSGYRFESNMILVLDQLAQFIWEVYDEK